eukprot:UN24315
MLDLECIQKLRKFIFIYQVMINFTPAHIFFIICLTHTL